MNIIGIIAEYNPFHNGHIYHIEKIKEKYPDSLIILVLNGYFTERGIISVLLRNAAFASANFTGSMRLFHFRVFTPKMGCVSFRARGIDMKRFPPSSPYCRRKSSDELRLSWPPVSGLFWVIDSCA